MHENKRQKTHVRKRTGDGISLARFHFQRCVQNLIVIMIWEGGGFAGGREEADEQMSMTISEKCVTT